jgi:hypothetical protein
MIFGLHWILMQTRSGSSHREADVPVACPIEGHRAR